MPSYKSGLNRLPMKMDLAFEKLPGQSLVEVLGTDRVIVENYCSIIKYDPMEIYIKTSYGLICVCGRCLELAKMAKEQLIIIGQIEKVSFEKGVNK